MKELFLLQYYPGSDTFCCDTKLKMCFTAVKKRLYQSEIKHDHYPCCLPEQEHTVYSDAVPVTLVELNVWYAVVCG